MPKIEFTPKHVATPNLWRWREVNRRLASTAETDRRQQTEFSERAAEVRSDLEFLLGAGLSSGAEESLAAVAEGDMVDFCIMVDLAEPIDIPGVEPLPKVVRASLQRFLAEEPWRSLIVDHDITVAVALLDSIGAEVADAPWYRHTPGLFDLLSHVLTGVNHEQLLRFVGEYNALAERDHLSFSDDVFGLLQTLVQQATKRLGIADVELVSATP